MAPRSVFNATITFGLVNVPVKLFTATSSHTVSFRELHEADGARLEHRRLDPESGEAVEYADIVKGFEIAEGEYVEVTKDEVKAAAGEKTKTIPVDEFVPAGDVDPVTFAKTYYLGARPGGEDAYLALMAALGKTERAGIGRMTFHDREYLVAVRALEDVLALHTLRFADELVQPDALDVKAADRKPSDRELKMAGSLVETLATDFTPDEYDDTYRDRVVALLEAKARGEQVVQADPEEPADSDDLMAALEASLKGAGK